MCGCFGSRTFYFMGEKEMPNQNLTGFPSVDKPWLKYYSEEAINAPLPESTIYEYLYEQNKDHLTDIALNYFDRKITYGELFENIEKTAKAFAAQGVQAGDIVTISSVTTPEIIYAFYALNRIGAVSNMVDPRTSAEGIKHYIEEVNSKLVVSIDGALPKIEKAIAGTKVEKIISVSPYNSLPAVKKLVVNTVGKLKGGAPKLPANGMIWNVFMSNSAEPNYAVYQKDTCCVIVHTGGTTGFPKGVMLSNENVNISAFDGVYCTPDMQRKQTWLNIMPPFIAYGIGNGLHLPLICGMEVIIIPQFNPDEYDKLMNKYNPNHMLGVPSHYKKLLSSPKMKNKDLSYVIAPGVGGDTMKYDLEEETNAWLKEHGCGYRLQKGYGMSEVSAAVTFTVCDDCNKIGSVGVPFIHTIISVFDTDTGEELKYGEQGEICMTGPNTMLGYYENEAETKAVLKTHKDGKVWVHSGDLGYMTENGEIFIIDRIKRMIVRHDGFKVFPSQIEKVIIENEAVVTCCVVGTDDKSHSQGRVPIAFVVTNASRNEEQVKAELFALCKAELPEYAQPVDFVFIDKLPLTPIGKVDYRKLEEMTTI